MALISLFLSLIASWISDLIAPIATMLLEISWYQWIMLVIALFTAAMTGGIYLRRKWREHRLKLEYYITKNPARVNEAIEENEVPEACLRHSYRELIYFKIRNKSTLTLPDNRIWIEFPRGFTILDEDEVNGLPARTPLGTLQEEKNCIPLLHSEKGPTFQNLIWGKGKQPTLLMPHIALYDPGYKNQTMIPRSSPSDPGSLFIPIWVRTPEKAGSYKVRILVKLRDIDKDLPDGILTLHVQ